jgi:hypothetical protein
MAEERLIDDDLNKDKKYVIRKNANGEEELVLGEDAEEQDEKSEEISYEMPELDEDDEEAAVMTPEQLAAKKAQEEKEKAEKEERFLGLLSSARSEITEGNFATALEAVIAAEELQPENGEVKGLKLVIYTRNFTDYSQIDKAAECADDIKEYTSSEQKAEMLALGEEGITKNINDLTFAIKKHSSENDAKKSERAVKFTADKNKALKAFICGLVPFAVVLALAIFFSTIMFSSQDGIFLVLTIVFAAVAFAGLIVLAFLGRRLIITSRRVRRNKKDTSTQLGRQLLAEQKQLDEFNKIYLVLKG